MTTPTTRLPRILTAVLCACSALSDSAQAADPWEVWPEASLFVNLSPQTRLYLDTAFASPYLNAEWFYDTPYDGWARALSMASSEFTVSQHFRFEVYLARQIGRLPSESGLCAFGVVAKWYY